MIIPDGYGQVNFFFTGPTVPLGAQVTFGVELGDPTDSAEDVAIAVSAAYGTANIKSIIATGCNMTSTLVKFGPNATGQSFLYGVTQNSTGGAAMDSPGVSWLIHKNTSFGGRSGRGRLYLPCPPEAAATPGGQVVASSVTQVNGIMEAFRAALEANNTPMVLLHGANPIIPQPLEVQALTCDSRIATQRRRLRR